MIKILRCISILLFFVVIGYIGSITPAHAQTSTCPASALTPDFTGGGSVFGRLPSQWNAYFGSKVDVNNGVICNPTIYNATFSPSLNILATSSQDSTAYTLASTDCNTIINFTALTRVLVTIPNNLPAGCVTTLVQESTGPVVPIPSDGVTLSSPNGYVQTFSQGSAVKLEVTQNPNGATPFVVLSGDNIAGFGGSSSAQSTNGMLTDASNASLPNALNNLGLGTNNSPSFAGLNLGSNTSTNTILELNGEAGFSSSINLYSGNVTRWTIDRFRDTESGNNSGSSLFIGAYTDTGAFIGTLAEASRASGPFGKGLPYWSSFSPFIIGHPSATVPGGHPVGSDTELANADVQPTTTLGSNPLSVTSGSPTVTINWPNCCGTNGPISTSINTWVYLSGSTAVGGITPSGWLEVQSIVDTNDFTITWTADAAATTTGGGTAVTIQPSFATVGTKHYEEITTGSSGFVVNNEHLDDFNPSFLPSVGNSKGDVARYESNWEEMATPADSTKTKSFSTTYNELDLINRGSDEGYNPNLYGAPRATTGFWVGPTSVPGWLPGGGTATNWNTVFSVFQDVPLYVYDGFSIQSDALTPAAVDPSGHGGVGIDLMGATEFLGTNPFSTTSGTSTITVADNTGGAKGALANGDSVYIPNKYTISGVTFGDASYTVSNVNLTTHTFQITGIGTAVASVAGGGSSQNIFISKLAPYAPLQFWGEYKHGLITDNFKADDGYLINTQVGNGYAWSDGTGTAVVTSDAPSTGNVNIDLNPAGTGQVLINGNPITPGVATVDTNAALAASTSTEYPNGVWRMGVTAIGDAPPLFFTTQSTACAAADGYLEVTLSGGGCAIAHVPAAGLDVREAGAVCNNTVDDGAAIQRAINYVEYQAEGGVVRLPAYSLCLTSTTIQIGNGSTTANSTGGPIVFFGNLGDNKLGPASYANPQTGIHYTGTGTAVLIQGPIFGWGIQGVSITCNDGANTVGINDISAQFGDNFDISLDGCATGILSDVVSARPSGDSNANAMHNYWRNIYISIDAYAISGTTYGIKETGITAVGNSCYNIFNNVWFNYAGATGKLSYGIYLQAEDTESFSNIHNSGGGGGTYYAVTLDYTVNSGWPVGTVIDHLDPASFGAFENIGTPGAGAINYLNNLVTSNGGRYPSYIAGLIPDHQSGTWTPVLAGKADPVTATYVTQSGTYTDNGWDINATFHIITSAFSGTSSDIPLITGLPFANSGNVGVCTINQYSNISLDTGYTYLGSRIDAGGSDIVITESGSGIPYSYPENVHFSPTLEISGNCTYQRSN